MHEQASRASGVWSEQCSPPRPCLASTTISGGEGGQGRYPLCSIRTVRCKPVVLSRCGLLCVSVCVLSANWAGKVYSFGDASGCVQQCTNPSTSRLYALCCGVCRHGVIEDVVPYHVG